MTEWAQRRFWEKTAVAPLDGGYTVTLDGRRVKTPAKAALVVPTEALAQEIAAEWAAQDKTVDPRTMPFTRSANAAIDKVMTQHAEVAQMIADYGDADLLCYRAASPADLVARQAAAWDPLLDWAAETMGARLETRAGVMHAPQDPGALARLRAEVATLDAFHLTALHDLVSLSGSLVIGLAALRGWRAPEALWETSRVDESWQIDQWGADEEAAEVTARKRGEFLHAHRLVTLL